MEIDMAYCPVKNFHNAMAGIPQLDNNFERLTALIDAVAVNGFNPKVITAITRVDTTATAQCTAHGYIVDQIVAIANADQPEYNGDQRVTSITTNAFTFEVPNTVVTPATTSTQLDVKAAPMGYEIVFSATGKRVYRSTNPASSKPLLRLDDTQAPGYTATYAKFARVTIASAMSDVDTFSGERAPYDSVLPNKNEAPSGSGATIFSGWYKWYYAHLANGSATTQAPGTGNRHFVVVGDDRGFHIFIQWRPVTDSYSPVKSWYAFGDPASWKPGDGYSGMLMATEDYFAANNSLSQGYYNSPATYENYVGKALLKDYTGVGNYTRFGHISVPMNSGAMAGQVSGRSAGIPFPNGPDYSLLLFPVWIKEERRGDIRGMQPGVFFTPHQYVSGDGNKFTDVPGYPGRKFLCVETAWESDNGQTPTASTNPRIFMDITGPWER